MRMGQTEAPPLNRSLLEPWLGAVLSGPHYVFSECCQIDVPKNELYF